MVDVKGMDGVHKVVEEGLYIIMKNKSNQIRHGIECLHFEKDTEEEKSMKI